MALSVVNDVLTAEAICRREPVPLDCSSYGLSELAFGRRFAVAYETAEHLSTSLQDEVNPDR